jgi:transposase
MDRLREIVRLHRLGRSGRDVARLLGMGRETTRVYISAFKAADLLDGESRELPDAARLYEVVACIKREAPQQQSSIERWSERVVELRDRGAGPTAIHDHLRLHAADYGGSLSAMKRFCRRLDHQRGPVETDVAIPVETAPGEVAQVDFGYAGKRYDPVDGVLRKSWVFVMTLGFSRHAFMDLVFDQKIETWQRLHVDAFQFFGGVPKVIVPDNLKAAVIRASFGVDCDPVINRSYRELARHYSFQIDPTPPRSPEKKGKVESGVKYVSNNFLATWQSVDIDEDRRQLRRWLVEVAGERRHGTTGRSPRELFEEVERAALLPLPERAWDPVVWKKAKLHRDSHVQVDGAFYSAPWRFLHEELWLRCTRHSVAIYRDDECLWTHARVVRGQRSTVDDHLPEHRRDLRHRSKSHWLKRARAIGVDVEQLAEAIFGSDDVLLQLRRVQAIVTHLESFPSERARATARRALHFRSLDYASIKSILRKCLDLEPLPTGATREWAQDSQFARSPDQDPMLFPKELAS